MVRSRYTMSRHGYYYVHHFITKILRIKIQIPNTKTSLIAFSSMIRIMKHKKYVLFFLHICFLTARHWPTIQCLYRICLRIHMHCSITSIRSGHLFTTKYLSQSEIFCSEHVLFNLQCNFENLKFRKLYIYMGSMDKFMNKSHYFVTDSV